MLTILLAAVSEENCLSKIERGKISHSKEMLLTKREKIGTVYTDHWFVWRCGMARNKYPEETVKLILDVATYLFVEKGYDATSLQDIINETHLSKGAIYHHFSSKEEILQEER